MNTIETQPHITILTLSYNQGQYLSKTIESVLDQGYPNLEHILVDRGSSDNTLSILEKYPHLIVDSDPASSYANALNRGLQMATGAILCILNPDDVLLPGALQFAAREIDPAHRRFLLTGGCRFVDKDGDYIGIKHPVYYKNQKRLLEIWRGYGLPRPSTFWSREVWENCGPVDVNTYHPDYDLFCRFSKKYDFKIIDTDLAAHRLQDESLMLQLFETEHLPGLVAISRKYWGSPLSLKYWQLTISYYWHLLNRSQQGRDLLHEAWEYRRQGMYLKSLRPIVAALLLTPDVAFILYFYSLLRLFREKIRSVIRK